MTSLIKVKDQPNFYRDPTTKAIIVADYSTRQNYINQRSIAQKSVQNNLTMSVSFQVPAVVYGGSFAVDDGGDIEYFATFTSTFTVMEDFFGAPMEYSAGYYPSAQSEPVSIIEDHFDWSKSPLCLKSVAMGHHMMFLMTCTR